MARFPDAYLLAKVFKSYGTKVLCHSSDSFRATALPCASSSTSDFQPAFACQRFSSSARFMIRALTDMSYYMQVLVAALLVQVIGRCSGMSPALAPAPAGDGKPEPSNFPYTQLWVDETGETHVQECQMTGFSLQNYSAYQQFVRDDFGGNATKFVFTELSVNLSQPLHSTPAVQFVITLAGSWYIKTTDGTYRAFQPGEVLFQDNTKNSPAAKVPQHYSGQAGDVPCQQFVLQINRQPEKFKSGNLASQ
ncbi:hypothetical protein R1flu_006242 [Riccia fluitans]|uniref:Cupin domain-containing protein n=1 Tax=Riccia fluitans TaxID=41844 RepID=A0ABD1YW71_9MARC